MRTGRHEPPQFALKLRDADEIIGINRNQFDVVFLADSLLLLCFLVVFEITLQAEVFYQDTVHNEIRAVVAFGITWFFVVRDTVRMQVIISTFAAL